MNSNNNNNNNNNEYGLVDNVNTSHVRDSYVQQELQDAKPPIQASQPALNINSNLPGFNYDASGNVDARQGGYIPGGTVLTDNYYDITDQGIIQTHSYSHNTSAQAEDRMRREQQKAATQRRSLFNTPPSNSGYKSYVNLEEPQPPSDEELEELRKKERYSTLKRQIQNLVGEEARQESKLSQTRRTLTRLRTQLADLEDS